jgi:hypothetical protein
MRLLNFFLGLVYGATQLTQPADSELTLPEKYHQERIRNDYLVQKDFLESLEFMEEHSFISYWYPNLHMRPRFSTKNKSLNFIKMILEHYSAEEIFHIMKKRFKKYMQNELFKVFLDQNSSKEDKEKLLFQTISLYQTRFRSVWARLGKPGPKKFNNWPRIFLLSQRIIDLGIYGSIEAIFHEIMKVPFRIKNEQIIYKLKKQFCILVDFLSSCESEKYGLFWLANHSDARLILSYHLYLIYHPSRNHQNLKSIKEKSADRSKIFKDVLDYLTAEFNFEFNPIGEEKVIFGNDFRNPYPPDIIGDKELQLSIDKIISKMWIFCDPKGKLL